MIIPRSSEMFIDRDSAFNPVKGKGIYSKLKEIDQEELRTQRDRTNKKEGMCALAEEACDEIHNEMLGRKVVLGIFPVLGGIGTTIYSISMLAIPGLGAAGLGVVGFGSILFGMSKTVFPLACPQSSEHTIYVAVNKVLKVNELDKYKITRLDDKIKAVRQLNPTSSKHILQKEHAISKLTSSMTQALERNVKFTSKIYFPLETSFNPPARGRDPDEGHSLNKFEGFMHCATKNGFKAYSQEATDRIKQKSDAPMRAFDSALETTNDVLKARQTAQTVTSSLSHEIVHRDRYNAETRMMEYRPKLELVNTRTVEFRLDDHKSKTI